MSGETPALDRAFAVSPVTLSSELERAQQALRAREIEVELHAREAMLLFQAATLAAEPGSFEEILHGCTRIVCEMLGWPVGHVYLAASENGDLVPSDIWHLDDPDAYRLLRERTEATRFACGEGMIGRIWESGEPLWIPDVDRDPIFVRARAPGELPVRGACGFPIKVRGQVAAVVEFFSPEEARCDERLTALIQVVGEQIGRAIERRFAELSLRRSEAKLREQAARLAEADRRKDEFLAMLAHELRNPLAPIRNAVEILGSEAAGERPGLQERALGVIRRQLEQLTRLVDDLLDVSRIGRGQIELLSEPVDLREIARRAVETSSPLIEKRRHRLRVLMADEPVWLEADPGRLTQVIGNLLNNAAKYTDDGGEIRLEVEAAGRWATVRVRDDGIGISSEELLQVFDPFARGERAPGRHDSGLGLGLSLVRRLVEMHGGEVEAHSDGPGTGSEFLLRLPRCPDA